MAVTKFKSSDYTVTYWSAEIPNPNPSLGSTPFAPIGNDGEEYYSTISLKSNKVNVTIYVYINSNVKKEDISLGYEGQDLYVVCDALAAEPTNVKLWQITAKFNNTLNITGDESIKIYCQDTNDVGLGDTDDPKTSRGTKITVKSGTGEI